MGRTVCKLEKRPGLKGEVHLDFLDSLGVKTVAWQSTWQLEDFNQQLQEGEEIIGCYGTQNEVKWLNNLGLIVWKPPKMKISVQQRLID